MSRLFNRMVGRYVKKIPCPCKGIWRKLKGTYVVEDSSLTVGGNKPLILKDGSYK